MRSLILGIAWLIIAIVAIFVFGYPTLMMIQDKDFDLLDIYALNIFLGCIIIGIAIFVGIYYLRSFREEMKSRPQRLLFPNSKCG
jgi:SNF family Na+-dependent transporter